MEHHHLHWPQIAELIRRCEDPGEILLNLLRRLFHCCPQCRENSADFAELVEAGELHAENLDFFTVVLAVSRRKAERLWAEIANLDETWARRRLEREGPLWGMVGLLAEESTRLAATDWKAALETAEWAISVAKRLPTIRPADPIPTEADEIPLDESAQLEALGLAYAARGNAYRVDERYVKAQEQFALLDALAVSMPVLGYLPRSLTLRASLYSELHQFEEALESLDQAEELVLEGSPTPADFLPRLHVKRATVHQYRGHLEQAVREAEKALKLHSPENPDRLSLIILWLFLDIRSRIHDIDSVDKHLVELERLCAAVGSKTDHVRLTWLQARIAAASGGSELALQLFEETAASWCQMDHGYKWALVRLETALVCLQTGDTARVRKMSVEALPILVSMGVSLDVVVAFRMLAKCRKLEVDFLRTLIHRLETLPPRSRRESV